MYSGLDGICARRSPLFQTGSKENKVGKYTFSSCNPDCPVQTPNRASDPKWEKNGRKMGFGPHQEKGDKWPKNAKNGSKMAIFPFVGHFSRFFQVGPKSIFRTFFPISGRRPDLGSVQGNRGCSSRPFHQSSGDLQFGPFLRGSLSQG